jgi:hypothetical protein
MSFWLGNTINFHTTKSEHMVDILLHKSAVWKGTVKIRNPFSSQIFLGTWDTINILKLEGRNSGCLREQIYNTWFMWCVYVLTHISTFIHILAHTNFIDFLKGLDQFQIQVKCSPDTYNFRELLLYTQFHKAL